ncbi:hypothetical protein [Achromobacter pestifer]
MIDGLRGLAGTYFVFVAGHAVDEPVFRQGQIAMSSQRGLARALAAHDAGDFGQVRKDLAA